MEKYFQQFRDNIVGINQEYDTAYGRQRILYADWIASGRLYKPIEERMLHQIGPFVANTHTETSETGELMTKAYHYAQHIIKEHVGAGKDDVIITTGFGMTSAVVKFQRILGLKTCGKISHTDCLDKKDRPVVFVTHMEHHSNHTSWFETMADVVQLAPNEDLLVDLQDLEVKLAYYKDRKIKIGSFTACSNVTGIHTPYYAMAKLMHKYGGKCFIDFAASAPYDTINMHPEDPEEALDAIFFSPHKFLGGPGSSGVLIFDSSLYNSHSPDQPGGGTVDWTNAWGEYKFVEDIEAREDGGTPGFLQAIRTALAIELKKTMGIESIRQREEEIVEQAFKEFEALPAFHVLADTTRERLPVFSFYLPDVHYNLIVRLLSDRFGIQVRGGCACAGTYGHFLLDVSHNKSKQITDLINLGDLSQKPGWIRLSLHPTTSNTEIAHIFHALEEIQKNHKRWADDYIYNKRTNDFRHHSRKQGDLARILPWFELNKAY